MASSDLLKLGNARKVKDNLSSLLNQEAIDAIEAAIEKNSEALYALALHHYRFAAKINSQNWRQKISRLYYSSYAASKAIRLYVSGEYSTEVKDHKKIGKFPVGFPKGNLYANKLSILREDRNTCDYDHNSRVADLVMPPVESVQLVKEFLLDTKIYLKAKGLEVRGMP